MERRLGSRGEYCDCEISMNGWKPRQVVLDENDDENDDETCDETCDETWPAQMPRCAGIPAGSVKECDLWVPQRRRC